MIAAVLSLIYISIKAYAMIVGEGRFDSDVSTKAFCGDPVDRKLFYLRKYSY